MSRLLSYLDKLPRWQLRGAAIALVGGVGIGDYFSGYEFSFSVFYLGPISLAAWFLGKNFTRFLCIASVGCWLGGDLAAGARYESGFVPVWNAAIALASYLIIVEVLSSLRNLHDRLEAKVNERTAALTQEMNKREELEKELLAISERERRVIGNDLHDSLCQHLTGTALAGQVLAERLEGRALPEAQGASRVVELIEEGIMLARNLARGLSPLHLEEDGLTTVLEEFAAVTSEQFQIQCDFVSDETEPLRDVGTAIHLYRIAQEAVNNAVRHGKATKITISLRVADGEVALCIEDNGSGIREPLAKHSGMGLRIMNHRAAILGGVFTINSKPNGGAVVTCSIVCSSVRNGEPAAIT